MDLGRIFDGFFGLRTTWLTLILLNAPEVEELTLMIRATRGRSMDGWMDGWMDG